MSILQYVEEQISISGIYNQDEKVLLLEPSKYREFLIEMGKMRHSGGNLGFKKILFNSIAGPIEIRVGKVKKQDPNDILKKLL